ncbi:DUF4139 domain-containing protein [Roseimaritima sediminicola]|uniref:DUF4139 domain-containing protein n=1 Tax=Roseimaritima sediminicola TaxID=2662066 RepID=UPI001298475A|nr:DUF4139 domain-containing protein [Roseimaritima sediminicola]
MNQPAGRLPCLPCHRRLTLITLLAVGCVAVQPVLAQQADSAAQRPAAPKDAASEQADALEMGGESIARVSIYRDQARVVRTVAVPAGGETQRIEVPDLPPSLVEGSVYTESAPGVTVRSLVVRRAPPTTAVQQQQLQQLQTAANQTSDQLQAAEQQQAVVEQDLLTIERLVDFSSAKVQQNLSRATLDAATVTQLADFTMQRRRTLADELRAVRETIEQLQETLAENQRQQERLRQSSQTPGYEAELEVDAADGGELQLVYRVRDVSWQPQYTIRAQRQETGGYAFALQLDARVTQHSGENWQGVRLTLSTARPDLQAAGPVLTPLRVDTVTTDLSEMRETQDRSATEEAGDFTDAISDGPPAWSDPGVWQRDITRNARAGLRQVEQLRPGARIRERSLAGDAASDIADARYDLDARIDLASRPASQTIGVNQQRLEGELVYVVTPLLSSFAHRRAELRNPLDGNLMAGSADVYLDDQFVGTTQLSPTAAGQRLVVGFGTDRQLRTRREILARESSVQGGNQRRQLTVRLVVSNYHDRPMAIRLQDRLPIPRQDDALRVALSAEAEDRLSKDPLYRRMRHPQGILRWDLEVPAQRFGSEAFDFDYAFSVEYDRQHRIVGDQMIESIRNDYQFENASGMGGMGGGEMGGGGAF